MNRIYYWIVCCVLNLCVACNDRTDDDGVGATDLDLDYFVVSDDYDNAIDSLRYEIFKKYNIAVYYDDTIGVYDRGEKDREGNTKLFYRVIRPPYSISGWDSSLDWREVEDKETLRPVMNMLLNYTFDDFPTLFLPKCFYLVEWMNKGTYHNTMEAGMVNIAKKENTPESAAELRGDIATEGFKTYYSMELIPFYEVTPNVYGDIYDKFVIYDLGVGFPEYDMPGLGIYEDGDEPMKFGFLRFTDYFGEMKTLLHEDDLEDFVKLTLSKTREDVYAEYADYPLVLEKYEIILNLWNKAKAQ
ncbi:hypothetical protein AALK14_04590 [Butyricimonas hominis]|uniref:hypothetical protein n=1 Tax=Butyricimonas TaxID=574697 RepID=UPI0035143F1B